MLHFYYNAAPNPMKIALLLEELGLPYEAHPVDTRKGEQFAPEDPEGAMQKWGRAHPIGYLIQPIDIARVIAFLASDDSKIITGAPILADGGLSSQAGVQ